MSDICREQFRQDIRRALAPLVEQGVVSAFQVSLAGEGFWFDVDVTVVPPDSSDEVQTELACWRVSDELERFTRSAHVVVRPKSRG